MELYEKTISSETVFKGNIVELRVDRIELPDGRPARREVIAHPGGVAILPYHDDGTVTVVRQFRYPFGRVVTELPAGKLERGEDHRSAPGRELEEETGLTAGTLTYLGCLLASPGYSDEVLHMYLARDLKTGEFHPDQDEFLERERVPFETLMEQVMRGELQDSQDRGGFDEDQASAGTVSKSDWARCDNQDESEARYGKEDSDR